MKELEIQGKLSPQNTLLEKNVLSALLVDINAVEVVLSILKEDDFYANENRIIYNAICKLYLKGGGIDIFTVHDELKRSNEVELMGGLNYLVDLSTQIVSSANLEYHCVVLKSESTNRKLIQFGIDLVKKAYEGDKQGFELVLEAKADIENLVFIREPKESIKDILLREDKEIQANKGLPFGLSTGFIDIDKHTSGLIKGNFVVLAAEPGEGKSVLAINIAKNVSQKENVLVFSLEMTKGELVQRLMSDELNLSVKEIRQGLGDITKCEVTSNLKMQIYDKSDLTVDELGSMVKIENRMKGVSLVMVDYLQLLKGSRFKKFGNREQEIAYITRTLKIIAKENQVPVIALSQLSRDKNRKRPVLSDLRESGSIEQDADGVLFIWRPHYHDQTTFDFFGSPIQCDESDVFIFQSKWRQGQTGVYRMKFNGKCSRFEDYKKSEDFYKPIDKDVPF